MPRSFFRRICNMKREDTQFFTEYSYERRKEGKRLALAICLVALYAAALVLYFLFCYISGWVPLFAISPILLVILIYFTWRRAFPDCYFEFKEGTLSLGYEMGKRRARREKIKIRIKDAEKIYPQEPGRAEFSDVKRVCDMSSSKRSQNRVCVISNGTAVIFDTTPALTRLLVLHAGEGCVNELSNYLKSK